MAVLLIHPQIAPAVPISPDTMVADDSATTIVETPRDVNAESALPSLSAFSDSATASAVESGAALPSAPAPMLVAVASPAPIAFLKPAKPMTVSVEQLRAENRRRELLWSGLTIASSSAATFDAITTRRAISNGAVELNPLLRPFAGNASLFAAIQVGPALLDYAGKKMMYSKHAWVRRMWWAPQSASFVTSLFCGAHNLAYH
jgi:hypothetical protein